jgi:hypothetical protein
MGTLRLIVAQLFWLSACDGATLKPRAAQAPSPAKPASLLGPFAELLANADGKDLSQVLKSALPKSRLDRVETLKASLRPDAKKVAAFYGPYVLSGKGVRLNLGSIARAS